MNRLILFGLQVLVAALIMSLPLFIAHPAWISDWISSMQMNNYAWLHPSVFSILKRGIGIWAYPIWGALSAVFLFACFQIWTKTKPVVAMMWSLGLTTVITPYVWSWDFVLLLPIWIYVFTQIEWKKKAILLTCYLIGWLGMAFIQLSENYNNIRFWWVPLWFMGTIALIAHWKIIKEMIHRAPRPAS